MKKFLMLVGIIFTTAAMMDNTVSVFVDAVEYFRTSIAGLFSIMQTGATTPVFQGFVIGAIDWASKKIENHER